MTWKFIGPSQVQLRNGDFAYVERKGHSSGNILIGTYKDKPSCWFASGFWRLDGPDKEENHRDLDIVYHAGLEKENG